MCSEVLQPENFIIIVENKADFADDRGLFLDRNSRNKRGSAVQCTVCSL